MSWFYTAENPGLAQDIWRKVLGPHKVHCRRCGARSSPYRPSWSRFRAQQDTSVWGYLSWTEPPPPRRSQCNADPLEEVPCGRDVQRWWGRPPCGFLTMRRRNVKKIFKRFKRGSQTHFGLLSPAKPALLQQEPLSTTRALIWFCSLILSEKVFWFLMTANILTGTRKRKFFNTLPPRHSWSLITQVPVFAFPGKRWNVGSW